MFDDASQGVDKYNHNGSLWAIFTNQMKWVVEFTKDQTLWYNYGFFDNEMKLIGLNSIENKFLIQKWFESRFLGIPKVEDSCVPFFNQDQYVEDTIQNGVKHTTFSVYAQVEWVKDTIQNGVKQTELSKRDFFPKDIIQDGLKINGTYVGGKRQKENVENIIKNGVKHIEDGDWLDGDERIEGIIQEGVKETNQDCSDNIARVEGIIRIGEKIS